jgi:aryl-alcohol dehydrogenase-like predicted oxidoreductase
MRSGPGAVYPDCAPARVHRACELWLRGGFRRGDEPAEAIVIDRRPLGSTGISVSALGMGCSQLGSVWHRKPDKESRAAVAAALDSGLTFFDTADCYGLGRSERLLGEVIRRAGKRSEVVIATKCGLVKTPSALVRAIGSSLAARNESVGGGGAGAAIRESRRVLEMRAKYSPRYMERSVEASLRRLRTDYLDVFFLHSPPREVLANGAIGEAFDRLKAKGKIRASGLSLRRPDDGLEAITGLGVDCIEVEVNLCASQQKAWSALLSDAATAGVAVVGRQPFGSGLFFNVSKDDVGTVRKACLQFALKDARVSVVIPGMTSGAHVRQNISDALGDLLPTEVVDDVRRRVCGSQEQVRQ